MSLRGLGMELRCRCIQTESRRIGRYIEKVEIIPDNSHCQETEIMWVLLRNILFTLPPSTVMLTSSMLWRSFHGPCWDKMCLFIVCFMFGVAVPLWKVRAKRSVWILKLHGSRNLLIGWCQGKPRSLTPKGNQTLWFIGPDIRLNDKHKI